MTRRIARLRTVRSRLAGRVPAPLRRALGLLTGAGRAVVVIGACGWVFAWRSDWAEAAVLATTCFVAVVVAYAFTFGRQELDVAVELHPQRVAVGGRAGGRVVVRPSGRRSRAARIEVPVGRAVAVVDVPSLGSGAAHEEVFVVPTVRRAVIPVGPGRSVRSDPLGLVRKEVSFGEQQALYVHPRTTALEELGTGFLRDLEGHTTNDLSHSDVAFHTLREYVPGDDRRYVHWRTSARIGTLMVRQFVDTRRSHLAVLLSTDPSEYADDDEFELAISVAASLAQRALRDDQEASILAGSGPVPCHAVQPMLDGMAAVEPDRRAGSLRSIASIAEPHVGAASIVALITGSGTPVTFIRSAAQRLPSQVRPIAVRADRSAKPGFKPMGSLALLTVPSLDDLARTIWAVTR